MWTGAVRAVRASDADVLPGAASSPTGAVSRTGAGNRTGARRRVGTLSRVVAVSRAATLSRAGTLSRAAALSRARTDGRNAVSRRALLVASAAAVSGAALTGCKGLQALGTPPPPAPDIVVLRAAIAAERLMVARYAAMVSHAGAGGVPDRVLAALTVVAAEHAAHLTQLKSRLVEPVGSSPSPRPSPALPVTGTLEVQLTALEDAEQAASDRLISQLGGLPASLSQLFASVAASEATHVPFLQASRRFR